MNTKLLFQILVLLFFVIGANAQQGINYKAIINDVNGNVLANTAVSIQFTILENGTTNVFQETHNPTTDANGIIVVNIGEGTFVSGDYNTIDWGSNPHYLKTEIDAGDGLTDMGTTEFKTVPYALYAKTAEETPSVDGSETKVSAGTNVTVTGTGTISNPYFINSAGADIVGENPGDMLYWNGDGWVMIPAGAYGTTLKMINGIPTWSEFAYPEFTTTPPSEVAFTSATCGGTIVNDGGSTILAYGVCWSTTPKPTIDDNYTIDGSGIGTFTSSLTGLSTGTTYYVRSYTTISYGTSYGNEFSFRTIGIGSDYEGGILAYFFHPNDPGYKEGEFHGLIAAPSDQSSNAPWGCRGISIEDASYNQIGAGNSNTIAIVTACTTEGIAAKLCYDLTLNDKDDWYLPSLEELRNIYFDGVGAANGGFDTDLYWTSSNINDLSAWGVNFYTGSAANASKDNLFCVRAVRTF